MAGARFERRDKAICHREIPGEEDEEERTRPEQGLSPRAALHDEVCSGRAALPCGFPYLACGVRRLVRAAQGSSCLWASGRAGQPTPAPSPQAKFPLFSKVEVNGKGAHPLFAFLKAQFGIKTIPWNFQKVCCKGTMRI